MKRTLLSTLAAVILTALPLAVVHADETTGEKMDSSARHATADVKQTARKAQDKMCAKGDAKCAAQKVKHAGQKAGEDTTNAAKDAKNKVD